MTEANVKINNKGSSEPPQLPSLRTRKRSCDELSPSNVDHTFQQQSPWQVSVSISLQDQTVAQSSLIKLDKKGEGSTVNKTVKEQQEATVICRISDPYLERSVDRDVSKSKGEEKLQRDRALSQTCTHQDQVFSVTSGEACQPHPTALEDHQRANNDLQCDLVRNPKLNQGTPSHESKEHKTEAVTEEPIKKRKRMGMCGLTEKERSRFLQMSKTVNGQTGREKVEEQMSKNKADVESSVLPPSLLPSPVAVSSRPSEEEVLRSSKDKPLDRPGTEVHIPATPSDVSDTVSKASCLYGKSQDHGEAPVTAPDPTVNTKSDPLAMDEEDHLENPNPQEVDCSSSNITFSNQEVQRVATKIDEKKHDVCSGSANCDEDKTNVLSANPHQGDDFGNVCEVGPSGDTKNNNMPSLDDEPGLGAVSTEYPQTMNTNDLLGSGCFDFVSDSQLNNIPIEDQAESDKLVKPSGHEEDASGLMRGLIKELSFLNRTVMAAHREIENMRRGSKMSKNLHR
ncbi:uncharacterized protein LOC133505694 isoform X2 [Syngnathoides biaculeatus]|uniref:uncharacterized protein LOC133505694 isoform X2 n=1 Tax=Syngnathoides biaculeatus TaxID=300417 RepID=UPI002ADE344D|nr:uncharacterized protein LOC133505694 isoform X2 [Syngnathoides biaculeatus]